MYGEKLKHKPKKITLHDVIYVVVKSIQQKYQNERI